MSLLDSEVVRIKAELGYPLLSNSAEPWVSVVAIFEQVIQPYLTSGASTTSSTAVTAAATPTAVTLTLASATGITTGDRLVVDVDSLQETATIQSLSGSDVVVLLSKAHSGTYPVTVEGGESIIRETLRKIADVKEKLAANYAAGELKSVDEVEFFQSKDGLSYFGSLGKNLAFWRNELAGLLGIENMWQRNAGGGCALSVY